MEGMSELLVLAFALLATGSIAGVTAGLFGVGGGFIVVPALLTVLPLFGADSDKNIYIAIGTSLATIIVSSARSVQAHHKMKAVDFPLLRDWAPWLVMGVVLGILIASRVDAQSLVLVFALGVLIYSFYFLAPESFSFSDRHYDVPDGAGRAALASGLGGFSALLGIGGGTPFVVTMVMCGRSLHQAVATASGVGFIIALPGTIGFLAMGLFDSGLPAGSVGYIHIPALLAISLASIVTAPLGVKLAHSLSDIHLKRVFGIYLLCVSGTMLSKNLNLGAFI